MIRKIVSVMMIISMMVGAFLIGSFAAGFLRAVLGF